MVLKIEICALRFVDLALASTVFAIPRFFTYLHTFVLLVNDHTFASEPK